MAFHVVFCARRRVEKTLLGVFLLFAGGMALGNVPQLPDWIKGKVPPVEKNALGGSFMSVDPVLTDANTGASFNRYLYALNSPYKYIDPDGRAVETPWDAANVAMGVVSLTKNLAIGNYAGAVVDVVGVVLDTAATVAPGVPGGAATAINAVRAVDMAAPIATKGADTAGKLFHYTDAAGAKAIQESGKLLPNAKGQVFLTPDKLAPKDVANRLFIDNSGTKGSHVVEVNLKAGAVVTPGKNPSELIHNGTIRDGRQANLEVKVNGD